MKANELRIGNWVQYYNEPRKVEPSSLMVINYWNIHDNKKALELMQPIPLTEEILLKCGFEEQMKWTFSINIKNRFDLVYYLGEKGWSLGFYNSSDFRNLKHLHKLQNLYFALTNQELNIEL